MREWRHRLALPGRALAAAVALAVAHSPSQAADVVISEFMAINTHTLADEDGDYSDWIELHNVTTTTVSLAGWYLTDNAARLDKWAFPAVSLSSGAHLLVFASDKNLRVAGQPLHTNFKLDGDGEFLALVRPDKTTLAFAFAPTYPPQLADQSYGPQPLTHTATPIAAGQSARYLVPPDDALGLAWTANAFEDSAWPAGPTGLGFEQAGDDFEEFLQTRLPDAVAGAYLRLTFTATEPGGDQVSLQLKFDDGFAAYLNGVPVAASNAPATPTFESFATAVRPNAAAAQFETFDLSAAAALIQIGTNVLALHAMSADANPLTADLLMLPELHVTHHRLGVSDEWRHFLTPTPGATNPAAFDGVTEAVRFSRPGGFYTNAFTLALAAPPGATIRYTLDGSEPSASAPVYIAPLTVQSRAGASNVYSQIPTQGARYGWQPPWYPPAGEVFKATVVRAQAWVPGQAPGPVQTQTYFVDPNIRARYPTLPVISLTSHPSNLFGNATGIYVPGNTYAGGAGTGNYYQDWERRAHLEFWDVTRTDHFAQDVGLKIHGATSPSNPQKGLHVIARAAYGASRLPYPLFHTLPSRAGDQSDFKRVILRAWGSYRGKALLYDPFAQMLAAHTDLDIQSYRPCVVFINGEYWGLHELRESNQNSWYHEGYYGIDRDDPGYDLIDGVVGHDEGDLDHWWDTIGYINSADLTVPANYAHVKTLVDVDNLILYIAHSSFVNHGDWPGHNEGKWRSRTADGRWRWTPFDFDHSFHDSWNADMLERAIATQVPFSRLFTSSQFQREFVNAYADQMNSSFRTNVMMQRFDAMVAELQPYMAEFADRWSLNYDWDTWLGAMSNNIVRREDFERPNLMGEFGLVAQAAVTLDVSPSNSGTIRINTIEIDADTPGANTPPYPWQGGYFRGVPITLTAIPRKGYRFAGWTGGVTGAQSVVTAPLPVTNSSLTAVAQFVPFHPAEYPISLSEIMYNPAPGGSFSNAQDYEFVELANAGPTALDLQGATFTKGIAFTFHNPYVLAPGQRIVIVANRAAFVERYGADGISIAGTYDGRLANDGETVTLRDSAWGPVLVDFSYGDGRNWPQTTDGAGHSLVPQDLADPASGMLDYSGNWRASTYRHGSPGRADPPPIRDLLLNEVMAHTDYSNPAQPEYDSNDWIELFNTAAQPQTLQHWYLSDRSTDLKQWPIPEIAIVGAGAWIAFDEVTGFHQPINQGFGLDKRGETLYLSYLPGTSEDRVADAVPFQGQERDVSWGRHPDGAACWYPLAGTPGTPNAAPTHSVVISELMYHPPDEQGIPNTRDAFIELHNAGATPVALATADGPWRLRGGVQFDFPPDLALAPDARLVLVAFDPDADPAARAGFLSAYGLTNGAVVLLGPYAGQLSNRGERLTLEKTEPPDRPDDPTAWVTVDEVVYFSRAPWPHSADGAGQALVRVATDHCGGATDNWYAALPTPGRATDRVALAAPAHEAIVFAPGPQPLQAAVAADATATQVAFFADGTLLGTRTEPPYVLDWHVPNPGTYALHTELTDATGIATSRVALVTALALSNVTATIISEGQAMLSGHLAGTAPADVRVYWGREDGGTDSMAWAASAPIGSVSNAGFSVPIHDLQPNSRYHIRASARADASLGWSPDTASFTTPGYGSWSNTARIRFDGYTDAEPLRDFPALVLLGSHLSGFSYAPFAGSWASLRFTDDPGTTRLPYDVDTWDTNGVSHVWVRIPTLTNGAAIRAYWGEASTLAPTDDTSESGVWRDQYTAVWHMEATLDNAAAPGTPGQDQGTAATAGLVGAARAFDGVDDSVTPALDGAWYEEHQAAQTWSVWARPAAGPSSGATILGTDGSSNRLYMAMNTAPLARRWSYGIGTTDRLGAPYATGAWQMVALVLSNGSAYAQLNDGPAVSLGNYGDLALPQAPTLGRRAGAGFPFAGALDEVRLAPHARAAAWLRAEYRTLVAPLAFAAYEPVRAGAREDLDIDDLPDAWERHHFGDTSASGGEDRDTDGMTDQEEYLAGTDPNDPASVLHLIPAAADPGVFAVQWPTHAAHGPGYEGVARYYDLQTAPALHAAPWEGAPDFTNLPGQDRWLIYTSPPPLPQARFFRARTRLEPVVP